MVGGSLQDFSVSPRPLGFGFLGFWVLGLGVWGLGLTIEEFDKTTRLFFRTKVLLS